MDRISELPEPALHHILSFLTLKEATQLSVLSKTWKQVSLSQPDLRFDNSFFVFDLWDLFFIEGREREAQEKIHQLFDVVERFVTTFCEQRLTINKFELAISLINGLDWSAHIDQWIRKAVDSNVRKLRLWFRSVENGFSYALPNFVLLAKSVVTLTIIGCKLAPVGRDFKADLSSLKKLHLCGVELTDDHISQNLFANTEILYIMLCRGFSSLHISGPVKLKKLTLSDNLNLERVYVDTLSLIEADFAGDILKTVDIRRCQNLRRITMMGFMNTYTAAEWLNQGLDYYPVLESLALCGCKLPQVAKISSASLISLEISHCRNLTAIKLNAPNLSEFKYDGVVVTSLQMLPISVSGTHSLHYHDNEEY